MTEMKPTTLNFGQPTQPLVLNFGVEDSAIDGVDPSVLRSTLPANRTGEALLAGARPWQTEAYNDWLGCLRGILDAGTGSGKTRLGIAAMHNWFHEHNPADKPAVVVWVGPAGLMSQYYNVMRKWGFTSGRIGDGYSETSPHKQVYITTYSSLKKVAGFSFMKDRNVLLILDECHRAGGRKVSQVLAGFQGDAFLGLSATPNRSDDICVACNMGCSPAGHTCVGGSSCNAGVFYSLSLWDGVMQSRTEDDELDVHFHVVHVPMDAAETIEHEQLSDDIKTLYFICKNAAKNTIGANPHNLFAAYNRTLGGPLNDKSHPSGLSPLQLYQNACNKRKRLENDMASRYTMSQSIMLNTIGRKSAWFHETIFGVERINGLCMEMGVYPHVYHSGVNTLPADTFATYPELNNPAFKARLQQWDTDGSRELKRWMRSASDALITCKALKEGFDQPDMQVLVMVSGTNEVRSRIQTIGRAFRGVGRKDIFMFVCPHSNGDMFCLSNVLHKTGIPKDRVHYHVGGNLNPTHLIVQETNQTGSE